MRLKLGRPSLEPYAGLFDVPEASGDLSITFLGVSSLLLDDGTSAVLTDGFFSRPSLRQVLLGKIGPSAQRIDESLARAGVSTLECVIPVHSHYDHALDSAFVASRTGATLVGGASTAHLAEGLPADRVRVATPGEEMTFGNWTLTLIESHHCPPDRYPGEITAPVVTPTRVSSYKCGEAWSIIARHTTGPSVLIQGSAGFVRGALEGQTADVAYLGVGQLGLQSEEYFDTYWTETVAAVGARRAVLTHWDDFFRPLDQPLRALPYAGDDLDVSIATLSRFAQRDNVKLSLPTVWQREDPWS